MSSPSPTRYRNSVSFGSGSSASPIFQLPSPELQFARATTLPVNFVFDAKIFLVFEHLWMIALSFVGLISI